MLVKTFKEKPHFVPLLFQALNEGAMFYMFVDLGFEGRARCSSARTGHCA